MADMLSDMMLRAQNLFPVWAAFGNVVAASTRLQFDTQGLSGGTPWEPLTPAYAAWKLAHVGPRPILVLYGGMRAGLTGRPMDIERYYPRHAIYGSDDEKVGFHQFGTQYMPARPPLVVTTLMNNELARLTADHIVGDDG